MESEEWYFNGTRQESEQSLRSTASVWFLIRPSSRAPHLALSYRESNGMIAHISLLVESEGVHLEQGQANHSTTDRVFPSPHDLVAAVLADPFVGADVAGDVVTQAQLNIGAGLPPPPPAGASGAPVANALPPPPIAAFPNLPPPPSQ